MTKQATLLIKSVSQSFLLTFIASLFSFLLKDILPNFYLVFFILFLSLPVVYFACFFFFFSFRIFFLFFRVCVCVYAFSLLSSLFISFPLVLWYRFLSRLNKSVLLLFMMEEFLSIKPTDVSWVGRVSSCGIMVETLDCGFEVNRFETLFRYNVHFRTNTLWKDMNLIIPRPQLCFYKWFWH